MRNLRLFLIDVKSNQPPSPVKGRGQKEENMKKKKISKWRIKRGVNFSDEMRKGKYGWNEAAHLSWFG